MIYKNGSSFLISYITLALEMGEGVRLFLENLGMLRYFDIFCARGFDLESDIPHINLFDLENSLMIESKADRAIIYANAQNYKPSAEYNLFEWLLKHSLDHYYINFIQSELTDLNAVARIQLPNEDLYDELEIVLPGHKKRLERAVASLRQEGVGPDVPAEIPVTQGWWGKPGCLPQAKFDFLCVSANLCASQQPENKVNIDFMVDSGSDVSTVQEKTLENLNLELIGPVYSCGIHGGNYTNLYKAQLEVGNVKLDIEVLASNYDSLGSRIVRHFRHVIDGKKHIWLKGNYSDPIPAILPTLSLEKFSSSADASLTNMTEPLPSVTQLSLPSSTSVSFASSSSSSSSEVISTSDSAQKSNATNQKCAHQTASLDEPSSESAASEPLHKGVKSQNCQSLYQSESSISSVQKTTKSNEFIPLLSTNSNDRIRIHPQNIVKNPHNHINSHKSTTSNVHGHDNNVRASDDRNETPPCHSSQEVTIALSDQENNSKCKKEENIKLCNFDESKSQQRREASGDFKCAGHKRPSVPFLDKLGNPQKVPKIDSVDSGLILPTLKDTDDDIDNINPFVIDNSHHSNDYQQVTRYSGSHNNSFYGQFPNLIHSSSSVLGAEGDAVRSRSETDSPEEVVHILSHSDDEDESHSQDNKQYDKSLDMMRQNSNFMPGVGTTVIIPVDDLEENEFLCQIKDVSNNCE